MTIDPEAIERFLNKAVPMAPRVKGVPAAQLRHRIQTLTGAPYQPKTEPRVYGAACPQLEGLAFALELERSLLFFGMRMGKTKIALDWYSQLRAATEPLVKLAGIGLVICHSPIGVDQFEAQVAVHSDLRAAAIRSGKQAGNDLVSALEQGVDLIIMSWSTMTGLFTEKRAVARGSRKGEMKLYPDYEALRLIASEFDAVIIDEVHRCQDPNSIWFKMAAEITKQCRYRLGLTGTPIGRNRFGIWGQAFLIEGGSALGSNYFFFEQAFGKRQLAYARRGGAQYEYVSDKAKLPLLNDIVASFSLSYYMSDIINVDVIEGVERLRMGAEQRKAYEEALELAIEQANRGEDDETARENTFIKMRQISSGFLPFVDAEGVKHIKHFADNVKLDWVAELVEKLGGDVQVVIFHEFVETGRMLDALLTKLKLPHGWLWGGTKNNSQVIDDFQSGKSRWLIANTAKGAMSVDLPMADYLLFFESPVSPIIKTQAKARPASRGSKTLFIDDLVCSPVENKILGFISEGKTALASMLNYKQELGLIRKR